MILRSVLSYTHRSHSSNSWYILDFKVAQKENYKNEWNTHKVRLCEARNLHDICTKLYILYSLLSVTLETGSVHSDTSPICKIPISILLPSIPLAGAWESEWQLMFMYLLQHWREYVGGKDVINRRKPLCIIRIKLTFYKRNRKAAARFREMTQPPTKRSRLTGKMKSGFLQEKKE